MHQWNHPNNEWSSDEFVALKEPHSVPGMEPAAMLKMTTIFQAWEEKQKSLKAEDIEITYSYWDGSGKA